MKAMYVNAGGLAVNGKELGLKDQTQETKPNIVEVIQKTLTKDLKSNQIFPEGYLIDRKVRENKER